MSRKYLATVLAVLACMSLLLFSPGPARAEEGVIKASLAPVEAVAAGAAWSVDGGKLWLTQEQQYSLAPGDYTVTFKPLPGFAPPPPVDVKIKAGVAVKVSGRYEPLVTIGSISAKLEPGQAVKAGAAWSLDQGQSWLESGAELKDLAPGDYYMVFKALNGWTSPKAMEIKLAPGQRVTVSAAYARVDDGPKGRLKVVLSPKEVQTAGARWTINSGTTWHLSGEEIEVDPGRYVIIFRRAEGWLEPWHLTVEVVRDKTIIMRGVYKKQ